MDTTNYSHGHEAEKIAAAHLSKFGYKIIDVNWRTKYCEIDIVAQRDKIVIFIEVKYRQGSDQGSGLEYITPKKLNQMSFAAEMWVNNNNWLGEYCLGAIEVSGLDFSVGELLIIE
jgi:Holliday junction resolvase-like predicted endonuclease